LKANYYPQDHYQTGSAIQRQFYDFLAAHRTPADEFYVGNPRPEKELLILAKEGVRAISLLDVTCMCVDDRCPCQTNSTLSDDYIDAVLRVLNQTINNITVLSHSTTTPRGGRSAEEAAAAATLLHNMQVYGFDEASPAREAAMRQLFGAIQEKWPWLRKMATVGWSPDASMPLDTWVLAYSKYLAPGELVVKQDARRDFESGGSNGNSSGGHNQRETWWYSCNSQGCPQSVDPECNGAAWPNPSFIEWPGIEGRVIFWLASLHAIPGMLFWANGYWSSQCPEHRPCVPLTRINNTAMVNFDSRASPGAPPGSSYVALEFS
jgi:hypothetical protein